MHPSVARNGKEDMTMSGPIRKLIPYEEFDYQTLMGALEGYACPRDRITILLRKGTIIRIKKGLYVFGDDDRKQPYSREILANLIYGPSYISLEYALGYHGIIPERVEAVTSVTVGRSRKFVTPVGLFVYRKVPMAAFRTGVDQVATRDSRSFLMAIPEKALADKVRLDRVAIHTQKELQTWLFEDLRIEPAATRTMNPELLEEYAARYCSRKILLLSRLIRRLGRDGGGGAYA